VVKVRQQNEKGPPFNGSFFSGVASFLGFLRMIRLAFFMSAWDRSATAIFSFNLATASGSSELIAWLLSAVAAFCSQ
jgi:hypothetical protein